MVFNNLILTVENKGAAYIVLIDPDRLYENSIIERVELANESNVDALFIGGSLMMDSKSVKRVKKIKSISNIPVILFPGGVSQLNSYFDAMLFMSFISSRNPHYLIGEQVIAAPIVKDLNIEAIPTGYILVDGGVRSAVEIISGARSLPMEKIDIIVSHALAGQYLGMKLIYLEAGSGAKNSVELPIIERISNEIEIPLVVGGGINSPHKAEKIVQSGASIVVIGNTIEQDPQKMKEFADAIHIKKHEEKNKKSN